MRTSGCVGGMLEHKDLNIKPQSHARVCQVLGEVGPAAKKFVASLNAFVEIIESQSGESISKLLQYVNVQLDISPLSLLPEFYELACKFWIRCGEEDGASILEELRILESVDPIYTERVSDGLFHALSKHFKADEWVVAQVERFQGVNWDLELSQRQQLLRDIEAGIVHRNSPIILEILERDAQEYPAYLSGLLGPAGKALVEVTGAIFDKVRLTTSLRQQASKHTLQVSAHPSLARLQALLLKSKIEATFFFDRSVGTLSTKLKEIISESTLVNVEAFCRASSFYDSVQELDECFSRVEEVIVTCQKVLELLGGEIPEFSRPSVPKGLERLRSAAARRLRFQGAIIGFIPEED